MSGRGFDESNTSTSAQLLAISDLHLGHELRRGAARTPPSIRPLDLHLGAFLDHYRTHRDGALPWRLIVVGDMVDFIAVTVTPDEGEQVPFTVTEEEKAFGLGTEPDKARWKLERVLDWHSHFSRKLAEFLAAGNELVIVRGNHDPEWGWPEVQAAFRAGIAKFAPEASIVSERIRFCDWFYLEPGRFYAEHGHFYDEYAATSDTPRVDGAARRAAESVATQAQRYFANRYASLDMNEVERWSVTDYIRWAWHGSGMLRVFGDYLAMCGRVLAFSLRASLAATRRSLAVLAHRRPRDDARLERIRTALLSVRAEYADLARALLALTRPPAEQSVLLTANMLYFDRLLLVAAAGLLAASCTAVADSTPRRAIALAAVIGVATVLNYVLQRARMLDSHPKLIAAAHRVAELFRVPVVVMGHSHRVVDQAVGKESRYYNLGTWLAPSVGDSGAGFPHVIVSSAGHSIRRWSPAGLASRP